LTCGNDRVSFYLLELLEFWKRFLRSRLVEWNKIIPVVSRIELGEVESGIETEAIFRVKNLTNYDIQGSSNKFSFY
jgi:hypothetical protein